MQKAVFAITIPHFFSPTLASMQFLHSMHPVHTLQRSNHTSSVQSLISCFNVLETLQINQHNFLIFNIQRTSN